MKSLPIKDYAPFKLAAVVAKPPSFYVREGDCKYVHNRNASMEVFLFSCFLLEEGSGKRVSSKYNTTK